MMLENYYSTMTTAGDKEQAIALLCKHILGE